MPVTKIRLRLNYCTFFVLLHGSYAEFRMLFKIPEVIISTKWNKFVPCEVENSYKVTAASEKCLLIQINRIETAVLESNCLFSLCIDHGIDRLLLIGGWINSLIYFVVFRQ